VRAIARMHGGDVDAVSDLHGTVVGITLRGPVPPAASGNITNRNPNDRIGSPPLSYSVITAIPL